MAFINKNNLHKVSIKGSMREIKNFTAKDAITPGNIVLITGGEYCTHHGIVVDDKCAKRFHKYAKYPVFTLRPSGTLTFWNTDLVDFPFIASGTKIINMFHSDINVDKIDTIQDLEKIYDDYKLIRIDFE